MAIQATPETSRGILGAIKDSLGLFNDTNKAQGGEENANPLLRDEYESTLNEVEVLKLVAEWKKDFNVYYTPIQQSQDLAFAYWVGNQRTEDGNLTKESTTNVTDNLIFEAVETFLPIATRANPDPLVSADESEIGQQIAKDVKVGLVNWADTNKLRRLLARMTRHWVISRLGAGKMYWDPKTKEIKWKVINPKKLIFDKDGFVDEGGHFKGEYIGEKNKVTADLLTQMFPSKKAFITRKAQGKMGTKLEYIEWWYKGTDLFYTLDDELLGKYKNPNWNYDGKQTEIDPDTNAEVVTEIQGTNHLKEPEAPYVFLGVFSTGLHPYDETSLILQNISIQDMVNRRWRQIDKNVEGMNNGMVVSGKAFTEDQASQAASALRKGVAIRVPNGDVRQAVMRFPAPALPSDVAENLQDGRSELRGIFGISGSTPQAVQKEDTVRGKILVNQQDSSRIGGGITEQIEQVADSIYNWVVQFMFVYYDEEHFVTSAGTTGGTELITLKNDKFPLLKSLTITVKEGSLVPKDPLTKRNEAIDLWSANAIDPLNFYKALDFPDPSQATNQLILWQMFQKGKILPEQYLPSFSVAQPQTSQGLGGIPPTQPGTGGPAVSPPPPSPPPEGNPTPNPQSQEAVQQEGQQLLASVPTR